MWPFPVPREQQQADHLHPPPPGTCSQGPRLLSHSLPRSCQSVPGPPVRNSSGRLAGDASLLPVPVATWAYLATVSY